MKILLVEDEEDIRTGLKELLEFESHECVAAEDGWEAKEILECFPTQFDLLISDFRMPRWTGVDLLNWCRKRGLKMPVLFITANTELLRSEKLALSDCCASLLNKPIDLDKLLKAIEVASRRIHAQDCKPHVSIPMNPNL